MQNKGLCVTCNHDKTCSFSRRFPVLQCEEFSIEELKSGVKKVKLPDCRTRSKSCSTLQEETIAE